MSSNSGDEGGEPGPDQARHATEAGARVEALAMLQASALMPDEQLPIAEAALAFAALGEDGDESGPLSGGGLASYRAHLATLRQEVAAQAVGGPEAGIAARIAALARVLVERHGYAGDRETYDDLRNANLMRVIDRKKGLPVALGILWMHAARSQGWSMHGLAFPGHFLVRLDAGAERAVLDPFDGGARRSTADLRRILKAQQGPDAELQPAHYAPVSARDVLLRLQNNVKIRLIKDQKPEKAALAVEAMLMLAPDHVPLWRDLGLLHAHTGNLRVAIGALETFLQRSADPRPDVSATARREAEAMLQELRRRLN